MRRLRSPMGRREFRWRPHEVEAICLLPILTAPGTVPLAEVEIRTANASPIRLFTDHPEGELAPIGQAIRSALRRTPASAEAAEELRDVEAISEPTGGPSGTLLNEEGYAF